MKDSHPDRESFDLIWSALIEKEMELYQKKYYGCIQLIPNAKEEIWDKYISLNKYCKVNYMKSPDGKIDRHKVAACYLIAISSVKPMRFSISDVYYKDVYFSLNEKLSITVAASLLRAFVISATISKHKSREITLEEKECIIKSFELGIKYPPEDLVNHGEYLDNFASEIHYAIAEGNINILSIAHELFLLEVITRILN